MTAHLHCDLFTDTRAHGVADGRSTEIMRDAPRHTRVSAGGQPRAAPTLDPRPGAFPGRADEHIGQQSILRPLQPLVLCPQGIDGAFQFLDVPVGELAPLTVLRRVRFETQQLSLAINLMPLHRQNLAFCPPAGPIRDDGDGLERRRQMIPHACEGVALEKTLPGVALLEHMNMRLRV